MTTDNVELTMKDGAMLNTGNVVTPLKNGGSNHQTTQVRPSESEKNKVNPYKKNGLGLRQLTLIGLLSAVTVVLGFTGWGFIPIPPINATILHVPTLIGALIEGPRVGMIIGLIFGCYSLIQNMIAPNVMSFAFLNPLVSVLPRILFGAFAYLIYKAVPLNKEPIRLAIATFIGAALHTVMVMSMIYFLFANAYAETQDIPVSNVANILIGVGVFHGLPEALVAVVITVPVVMMVRKIYKKDKHK